MRAKVLWVVDIFIEPKLCIEVDGKAHVFSKKVMLRDAQKELWLGLHGYDLLRFGNFQVNHKLDDVIRIIRTALPHGNTEGLNGLTTKVV